MTVSEGWVEVRIAVAVDAKGHWNASGWGRPEYHPDAMEIAIEGVDSGEARYWVTAKLLLPREQSVLGQVEEVAR